MNCSFRLARHARGEKWVHTGLRAEDASIGTEAINMLMEKTHLLGDGFHEFRNGLRR